MNLVIKTLSNKSLELVSVNGSVSIKGLDIELHMTSASHKWNGSVFKGGATLNGKFANVTIPVQNSTKVDEFITKAKEEAKNHTMRDKLIASERQYKARYKKIASA